MAINNNLIRLSKSSISVAEKKAVLRVLTNEYLGMGAEVEKFEKQLSALFNRDAICVVNGTAALHLALQSCNIGYGDEILVPTLTYISSFQAISATGAIPIACDIDKNNLCLNLNEIEKKITSRTKGIIYVHYSGGSGDLDKLYILAKKYKLRVIEDAAHAFGSKYKNKLIGSFGDIVCFSFDGIKNITAGEGGCIVTSNYEEIQKIKDARLLGVQKDTESRYKGIRTWEFDVVDQGWRYHMSNIMAAIGVVQLSRFEKFKKKRVEVAKLYDSLFFNCNYLNIIKHDYNQVVPHIYVVRIKNLKFRKQLQDILLEKYKIQTGIHYQLNHKLTKYNTNQNLIIAENIYPELLTLPMHYNISKKDVKYIANSLIEVLSNYNNLIS